MRAILLATLSSLASCLYDVPPLADMDASADLDTGITGGCTCVPAIPDGWTPAVYEADKGVACPAGYGAPTDWVENPTAPASTCTCACANPPLAPPTCPTANVTFNLQFGPTGQCAGVSGTVVSASSCSPGMWPFNSNMQGGLDFVKASPAMALAATGGTCAAPMAAQTIPPATSRAARSCQLQAAIGRCAGGACIPSADVPYRLCITKPGTNACPAGFPNAHIAGDGVSDGRGCGPDACTCAASAGCTVPNLHLYTNGACSLSQVAVFPADGSCQNVAIASSNITIGSTRYNALQPVNPTCTTPGTYGPTGALSVTKPTTFCCL